MQYGAEEEGVVYPGDIMVSVELDPEAVGCSDVTADDTSCIATITSNDDYTVILTVTNSLNSSLIQSTFDCELYTCMYMYVHKNTKQSLNRTTTDGEA